MPTAQSTKLVCCARAVCRIPQPGGVVSRGSIRLVAVVSKFSCLCEYIALVTNFNLVLRDRSPSTATEPLPRDEGMRGWCMARPMYVARGASQKDTLQDYKSQRVAAWRYEYYVHSANSRFIFTSTTTRVW
eukprot:scaffold188794_cov33-Tisochrysis_lutea.AAC.2